MSYGDDRNDDSKYFRVSPIIMMKLTVLLPVMFFCITGCASFKQIPNLPEGKQMHIESGNYWRASFEPKSGLNYVITFPAAAASSDSKHELYPLIIFLHSLEERGNQINLVVENDVGMGRGVASFALEIPDFPFITISPLCPKRSGWPLIIKRLDTLLSHVIDEYPIDTNRIYLTGVSMGGMGTWAWAINSSDRFAAIAPIAGGMYSPPMKNKPEVLTGIPIWVFHDAEDPSIPVEKDRDFANAVEAAGGHVLFTTTHEGRHYIQEIVFSRGELFEWFDSISQEVNRK